MAVVIRCPMCKTKFRWLAVSEPYPRDCPECGAYVGHDRDDADVVVPNILSFSTRCSDGVYRAMEKSSEDRMYAAAEQAGCSPSEMSGLKITNLRDNMKQGDVAAMPVVNDVTRQMDAIAAVNPNSMFGFGAGGGEAGLHFGAGVASGHIAEGVKGSIMPNVGAKMQRTLNQTHGELMGPDATVSRPANEMFAANYRPRV
jgi:hypothetical protein